MITQTQTRKYRGLRKDGWRANEAYRFVQDDRKLEEAEDAGLIRFRWEEDYSPDVSWMDEQDLEKMERGYWLVLGCVAERPARTLRPFADVDTWEVTDSLWGIVGPFDQTDRDYRRSVEIDLAYESGVLA